MGNWTLETIAWDRFDASKVDPEILRNIKAAALVERNGSDYGIYLDRKSTRLNSSHIQKSRMPSSA